MAGRRTMQLLTLFTLDGNNHLGQIEAHDFDISISEVDGSSGAASDEVSTEVKRSSTHNFTLKVDNGSGAPMTSAQIATESVDGRSLIGLCKSFSLSVNNRIEDGSGHGNLDTYPVATKRKVMASMSEVIDYGGESTPELITAANSSDPADRAMIVSWLFGAGITVTMPTRLTKATKSDSDGSLTKVDASFSKAGPITAPVSGTSVFAVALIGDALVTAQWVETDGVNDTTYTVTGVITSLTITSEDGQIVKATGTIDIQGPAAIVEDAL
jgi:hypothetical protein